MYRTLFTLAIGAALGAGGLSLAQHGAPGGGSKVVVLSEQNIAEKLDGKEARATMLEVSWDPGGSSAPHRHPGPVFGYVLEGEYETQLDGQPMKKLKAGDTFYEPAMALHAVSRNPSATKSTRVLVVLLHPRDAKHLVLPEKGEHPKK
jgi:quercetin dioxygenase-like cupin family protein